MMQHTNELERAIHGRYLLPRLPQGTNLRRTEITIAVETIPMLCGTALQAYSTYFYEQAGMSFEKAFTMSMAQSQATLLTAPTPPAPETPAPRASLPLDATFVSAAADAIGVVGTLLAWFLIGATGRRTVYLGGLVALDRLPPRHRLPCPWWTAAIPARSGPSEACCSCTLTYDASVGPVSYSLVTELSSTRLKNKSVVLARNVYNIAGIIVTVLPAYAEPHRMELGAPRQVSSGPACPQPALAWGYFRLPEPKGRTYGELDILFEMKVPARKFQEHGNRQPPRGSPGLGERRASKCYQRGAGRTGTFPLGYP